MLLFLIVDAITMALRNVQRIILQNFVTYNQSSVRSYSRWAHRKSAKVLLPFEPTEKVDLKKEKVIDLDPKILRKSNVSNENSNNLPIKTSQPEIKVETSKLPNQKSNENIEKIKKRQFYLSQKKVFDENNELMYEKLKDNDGRISNLLVKLKSKKERLRSGQVLVEGWRMIVDGLQAKCPLNYLIVSQIADLNNIRPFLPKTGVKIFKIPYKEIQMWSDVETPPGIFGVFETPKAENIKVLSKPLPLNVICDNIRVPGNLGTILRVAVGAGAEKVILSKGCVDLWEPKVIRSAAGAHFRLPIHSSVDWDDLPSLLPADTSVFIADSNTKVEDINYDEKEEQFVGSSIPVLPYYGVEYPILKNITLVIGGETEGISAESYQLAEQRGGLRLNIPLQKGVDSLNTGMAAAIITFEIKKQILQATAKEKLAKSAHSA